MTIDVLLLLLSRTKVEALVVYRMISCFPAICYELDELLKNVY